MIDIEKMIRKEIENGYGDANAQSKVCQDLIIKAISKSRLNRNVTIKGGVVMRSKTGNVRRATQDIDLGVHNRLDIEQEEYCFDIAYDDEGASLLINSNEQMVAEKLRALLKFGTLSNRYKDIYDIYYLISYVEKNKLKNCLAAYILDDNNMRENNLQEVYRRISMIFKDKVYMNNLRSGDANWLGKDTDVVVKSILHYIKKL